MPGFTDSSTLHNPGPTGAGAAIFIEGIDSNLVVLSERGSKSSNNYHGELVAIEIAQVFERNDRS